MTSVSVMNGRAADGPDISKTLVVLHEHRVLTSSTFKIVTRVKDEHLEAMQCFIKPGRGLSKVEGMTFWCISARNCKYEVLRRSRRKLSLKT